jgi:hypothetical protein
MSAFATSLGVQHGLHVGRLRRLPVGLLCAVALGQAATLEERPHDRAGDRPDHARCLDDVLEIRALAAIEGRQTKAREEVRNGDTNQGIARLDETLRLHHVGAPAQQLGRQARRRLRRHRREGQQWLAVHRPGRAAEQVQSAFSCWTICCSVCGIVAAACARGAGALDRELESTPPCNDG